MDAVLLDRVGERANDVLLPDDVGEGAWSMTAIQRGHGESLGYRRAQSIRGARDPG